MAEIAVLEAVDNGLDAVILNPVGVVGPNDFGPSRMGSMLLRLAHGTLPGIVHGGFYWVDVRDVAQAGLSATTHGVCGERYIIWGQYVTIPQIADWVQACTATPKPKFAAPLWLAHASAPLTEAWYRRKNMTPPYTRITLDVLRGHQSITSEKAVKALGFTPRPISTSVYDALEWFASNGHFESGIRFTRPA